MKLEIAYLDFAKTLQENRHINSSKLLTNKQYQNKTKNYLLPLKKLNQQEIMGQRTLVLMTILNILIIYPTLLKNQYKH